MKAETIRLVPPQKKLPPPLSARVKPLPKVEKTEAEKVRNTAHKMRQGVQMAYHNRETDEGKIHDLTKYLIKCIDDYEAHDTRKSSTQK